MRVCKHCCGVKLFGFSRANHASTNVAILSTWEVWRALKRLELHEAQLLRLFRALQTSRVLNISTYAQLQHELIVK